LIVLHQFEISPFCDKVRRVLRYKGQAFETREVPTGKAPLVLPKLSRTGKLPCLEHDGRVIADSTDIAEYLEELFPEPPLIPEDPRERALCHVLEDWADESLYFYEMTLRFGLKHNARRFVEHLVAHDPPWMRPALAKAVAPIVRRTSKAQGVGRKSIGQLRTDLARHTSAIEGLLQGQTHLIGDRLTLADIAVAVQLLCIRQTPEGQEALAGHDRVAAWLDRVCAATDG